MVSRKKKFTAVLFDFDGVIGKTMGNNYRSWKYAFSKYDINIDKKEYFLLEGMTIKKIAEHFLRKNSKNIKAADVIAKVKDRHYIKNRSFSMYSGVKNLLSYLRNKGYILGMVSGGTYKRILKSLKSRFLKKYFDVVITGDDVAGCKPNPEPYLTAAKKLSVRPSYCVAVENAPLGIKSAKRAGMYCIAVSSTLNKKYLSKADKIINRISELSKIL